MQQPTTGRPTVATMSSNGRSAVKPQSNGSRTAIRHQTNRSYNHPFSLIILSPRHRATSIMTRNSAGADKPARRDARYIFGSVGRLRYIFCNYRKANCTPSTVARGSARDVTSPTPAAWFNCSVFHILPPEPHPDYLFTAISVMRVLR